jgi:DNA-binding NarL/FixJ family response regulator
MTDARLDPILDKLDRVLQRLDKVVQRLDSVIRVGVLGMTQGKSRSEQIWLFSAAGLQPKEIAHVLGTTPNTVRVVLFNLRKSRRSKASIGGPK